MEAIVEENAVDEQAEMALTLFVEAIELSSDLEIIGTAKGENLKSNEVFVIRDHSKAEGIDGVDGAYVEVSIDEIVKKVTGTDRAQDFIKVIQNDRKSIVLHGITRIVGYYSRVNNWNKSKVGELRDRAQRNYGLTAESPKFDAERMNVIDEL